MTVLSADKEAPRKEGGLQSFPVKDDDILYKGGLVTLDASGYAEPAVDTAGRKFAGVAYEKVDNTLTGHSAGGKSVRVYTQGVFKLVCSSITQAMVGQLLFVVDDQTVDETTTNSVCVGKLVEYISATEGWVDIGQRSLSAVAGTIHGALTFSGAVTVTGTLTASGVAIILGVLYLGAGINITGAAILNSGLSVAGQVDLQTVFIHSQLYMAGILHFCPRVDATTLPSADPSVAGELWCNVNVVTRSTGT